MRSFDLIRSAIGVASLVASFGSVGTAFAAPLQAQQPTHQASSASPYDSPNFAFDESNIHS
jgi:hypothetical protein